MGGDAWGCSVGRGLTRTGDGGPWSHHQRALSLSVQWCIHFVGLSSFGDPRLTPEPISQQLTHKDAHTQGCQSAREDGGQDSPAADSTTSHRPRCLSVQGQP